MIRLGWILAFALSLLLCAAQSLGQEPDVHPKVQVILNRAMASTGPERLKNLNEALELSIQLKDPIGECTAYFLIGSDAQGADDFKGAFTALSKAADTATKAKFRIVSGLAHNKLGLLLLGRNDLKAALPHYEVAISQWEGSSHQDMLCDSLNGAAFCLSGLGDPKRAIPIYRRSLEVARKNRLDTLQVGVLNNLALALAAVGERSESIRLLKEAMPLAQALASRDLLIRTLNNYGVIYQILGDWSQSVIWLNQALPMAIESKNSTLEGVIRSNLALQQGATGELEKSMANSLRALQILRSSGQLATVPTLLNNIAMAQMLLGDYPAAKRSLLDALDAQRVSSSHQDEAFILMNLGSLDLQGKQVTQARSKFLEALPIATLAGDTFTIASSLSRLAETYSESDPKLAIAIFKQSINKIQALRADVHDQLQTTRDAFKNVVKGTYELLADLLVHQGRLAEAQQVLDLLKEDELFRFVRRKGTGSESVALNVSEAEYETRYRAIAEDIGKIGEEYGNLLALQRSSSASPAQAKRLKVLEHDLEVIRLRFEKFISSSAAEFKQIDSKRTLIEDIKNTANLKKSLRLLSGSTSPRTVCIYTVMAESNLHLIITTPELQDSVTIQISQDALRRKIFDFRTLLQNPKLDPRPLGKELYDLLIAPIEKKLGTTPTNWLWSLDGALRYLPIEALWDGQHYAVETRSHTVFTPAGQSDLTASPDSWKAVAFGSSREVTVKNDEKSVRFANLPGVPLELAALSKAIPTSSFLDGDFTRDAFFGQLRQNKSQVVHVATHFHFEAGRDEFSYLVLGSGESLRFSEISAKIDSGLFDGVELLTLSACETALSSDADGRDFEGLAALAQRAGVRSVLASLWPVSDGSTRALMGRFYENRGASPSLTKADALRRAQLAMIRGDIDGSVDDVRSTPTVSPPLGVQAAPYPASLPKWSHPYYWAPFVLLGNPR